MGGIRKPLVIGENDLATLRPDLLKDWDWNNNTKSPTELMLSSSYRALWVCHVCGHKWESRLDSRTKNMHGCPMCARGRGSSVADYTLFKLIELSLDCEVLYRYNVLVGCEADVYIPEKGIVIEYDGYGFHKNAEKRKKDLEKENRFIENGLEFYRIVERKDRVKEKFIDYNVAYVPEISYDSYEYLKDVLAEIIAYWGILDYSDIPTEYFELSLEDVKVVTRKPNYSRSLACALFERNDVEWDYDANGTLKPEDIFRSVKFPKVWIRCKNGHRYETTPRAINDGFKCRVCMGKENKNFDRIYLAYNLSLVFDGFRDLDGSISSNDNLSLNYKCPFCGTEGSYKLGYVFGKEHFVDYCNCTKAIEKAGITIIGKDSKGRIFYCMDILERYFLVVSNNIQEDTLLSKLGLDSSDIGDLNITLFREYLKDTFIMETSYNDLSSVPVNKKNLEVFISDRTVEDCLIKLKSQIDSGLKIENRGETLISVSKDDVVLYLKNKLEDKYGHIFAVNRTVDGINTDLACKKLGMYFIVRINVCKRSSIERYKNWYFNYRGLKMFFISSLNDCIDEGSGFFYMPEEVFESEYKNLLEDIFYKFVNYYSI